MPTNSPASCAQRTFLVRVVLTCAAIVLASPSPARAVLIRHDRPDTNYKALAQPYAGPLGNVAGAMGTLIADRWVLTAGHVATNISPFSRSFRIGSERVPIADVYLYPGWGREVDADGNAVSDSNIPDLALIRLARPVRGVRPARLHRKTDERGMKILVIGNGLTGTGEIGPNGEDGVMRAATNVIDEAEDCIIAFSFSAPGDSGVTDLEGIGGPGDSGGPAFAIVGGTPEILGVSSINHTGPAKGSSQYGSTEIYARVSTSLAWIDRTLAGKSKPIAWTDTLHNVAKGWPNSPGGRLVTRWLDAYNSRDSLALVAFEREFRADSLLTKKPAEARAASWRSYYGMWGRLEPSQWIETPGSPIKVLVHATGPDQWMRFEFTLEAQAPHKLTHMLLNSPEDPGPLGQ